MIDDLIASAEILWLTDEVNSVNQVQQTFLFGSFLTDNKSSKDLDVVMLYSAICREDIFAFVKYSMQLKESFSQRFQRSLHITAFAPFELDYLPRFMNLCGRHYQIGKDKRLE